MPSFMGQGRLFNKRKLTWYSSNYVHTKNFETENVNEVEVFIKLNTKRRKILYIQAKLSCGVATALIKPATMKLFICIDMEIKDVREYERVQHEETNKKVVGAGTQENLAESV